MLKAVIFSDGSTLGDPEWAKDIVEDRREVYSDARVALKELSAAERTGVPIKDIVARFRSLAWYESEKQVHPARPGSPWTAIAPPVIFGNIEFNLARAEARPKIAQEQAIEFWYNGMRNLVHQLRASRPTILRYQPTR